MTKKVYSNNPDKVIPGATKVMFGTKNNLWQSGEDLQQLPDQSYAISVVEGDHDLVLEIEHWPHKVGTDSDADILDTIDKFETLIGWLKPYVNSVGIYRIVPQREYWIPVNEDPVKLAEWEAANDFMQPLADAVDILYPSLYTFYDDHPNWVKYARANMEEARRLAKGKPVRPFMWPRYQSGGAFDSSKTVAGDYWSLQLKTLNIADGVLIWDVPDFFISEFGGEVWTDTTPWRLKTWEWMKFMSYRSTIASLGATYHWPLDELSGTAIDDILQSNNGTYAAHATPGRPPLISSGRSVLFDGTDDTQSQTTIGVNTDGAWSLACWLQYSIAKGMAAVSQNDGAGTGRVLLGARPTTGEIRSLFGDNFNHETASGYDDGQTHLAVVTFGGGTNGDLKIYVDGVLGFSDVATGEGADGELVFAGPKDPASGGGWDGYLDEIAFWEGKELTAEEVSEIYEAGLYSVPNNLRHVRYGVDMGLGVGL